MSEERPGGEPAHGERPDPGHPEPSFRHYVATVRRRFWVIVTVFVVAATLGTVHAFKATPIYRATAEILVEKQPPRLMKFEDVARSEASEQDYYETQQELVKSRSVMETALEDRAVRELPEVQGQPEARPSPIARALTTIAAAIGVPPPRPPEPWERLRDHLSVQRLKGTHLIEVKAKSTSPERAALLATAVARAFEKHSVERKTDVGNAAFRFLQEERDKQEKRLREAEDGLQAFREKAQVVSLDVTDKRNPIVYPHTQLNEQLTRVRLKRVELAARSDIVREAAGPDGARPQGDNAQLLSLPAVRGDEALSRLRARLLEAQQKAATLSTTYGPAHPLVAAAHAAVELLRAKRRDALGQLLASLQAELQTLTTQEHELERQFRAQNRLALDLAKKSLAFKRLERDVERQSKLFDILIDRMREVDLTTGYGKANIQMVEPAQPPRTPYRPRKTLIVVTSALMGLLVGLGLAFAAEHFDDTVKTPEDMEDRVGIPVLGFVPDMDTGHAHADGFAHRAMVSVLEPASSVAEAYRTVRTSLFFSAPPEEAKVLVVTSSSPGGGKSTTATNLALVIAQSGKRVLLVDADFRRPVIHDALALGTTAGLSTVLVGQCTLEEAVQRPEHNGGGIENLDVLVAGPQPPNPAELLGSQSMRRFLEAARRRYDRVILDSPPALFVTDATILGALCDGVVLVVRAAGDRRSAATRVREQLEGVHARILGGVLNRVSISRLGYYDSGYYDYGYGRYTRDYRYSYYGDQDEEAA